VPSKPLGRPRRFRASGSDARTEIHLNRFAKGRHWEWKLGRRQDAALKSEWDLILTFEGMPPELNESRPKPTVDRDWASHFGGAYPNRNAFTDACDRMALDARVSDDLFSMLADIRWGRHDATIEALTNHEREVFDPYCDGESFETIGKGLGLSATTVLRRFYLTLERFTPHKPSMRRNTGRRTRKTSNPDK
jgi:hypothetical protein